MAIPNADVEGFFDDGEREAIANGAGYPRASNEQRQRAAASSTARPMTPSEIAQAWSAEGQLVRVPTGLRTLDEACRGGLPIPWRVVIVGAPSAGKTALEMWLVHNLATDGGLCVGVLGVDEEPDDLNMRLAQMAGFTIAQCEQRDPSVMKEIADALAAVRVRFYDADHTIEAASDDLAAWAASEKRRGAMCLESIQTVHAAASGEAKSPRERIDVNLRAMRAKGEQHRLLMVATSEANRGSYRSDDAAETSNDMAAGKESGSIEFSAQTLIMVRTPKGHPDVVHVRVPKNRRGARAGFEFFLRLDRDRHQLAECADPTDDPDAAKEEENRRRTSTRLEVERDALVLAAIVRGEQGLGEVALRGKIRVAGHTWGVDRLNGARELLKSGLRGEKLVDRTPDAKGCKWHLEQMRKGVES